MPASPLSPQRVRSTRAWSRIVLAFLVFTGVARSAAPRAIEYITRSWTTDDGLPHNSVGRIVQDHAGFMWFATVGGLARFDGREFKKIVLAGQYESLGFNIRGLAEEKPGTLLVIPTSGQLLRLTGTTTTVHPATSALTEAGDNPVDLHVEPSGAVWIGTYGGKLLRWQPNGTLKWYGRDKAVAGRSKKFTFANDEAGRTWVASDGFLAVDQDGELVRHEEKVDGAVTIAQGKNGSIWVCTATRLLRLEHGRLTLVTDNAPWKNTVRHMFEDSAGNLWVTSSRFGIFRYSHGRAEHINTPYTMVPFFTEDREGNLWATTDSGAVQLREKAFQLFNLESGLRHESVSTVSEDASGRVWLANHAGGVATIGPDELRPQPIEAPGFPVYANVVCVDASNRLWLGGTRYSLKRVSLEGPSTPERMAETAINPQLLFAAKNGDVWFAAGAQFGCYHNDILQTFVSPSGQNIRGIAEDPAGHIWLGGAGGNLLRWDGSQVKDLTDTLGPTRRLIHSLSIDADGLLWICTVGGLVVKDGDRVRVLTQAQGMADDILQDMLEDEQGRVWFTSPSGFFHVAKSELLAVVRGQASRVTSRAFGRSEGLTGISFTSNYQPAKTRTRDGRLWFATSQGAVVIDPSRLPRDLPPPPVVIDELRFDDQLLSTHGEIRIPSGPHRIGFKFAALTYTAPDSVLIRHQLEGVDSQWLETGSDRAASYSSLQPGHYRLRVVARNSTGQWNNDGASLNLIVVPAWWETLTAKIVGLLLLLGISGWFVRIVSQRRLKARLLGLEQEHALEKERVRIARDLHDDLGASLTEVGLLADRLVSTPPRELAPQLAGLARRTRRLSTDLSGIVWTMSPQNSTLDRLGEFLRQYAQRLFSATTTQCTVRGAESLPPAPLAPDPQHQLLATTKEALNNVLKHSRAKHVLVTMSCDADIFQLVVDDDGVGFTPTSEGVADGNGLRNMKARIDEIGGTLDVVSRPGEGTRVTARVPLRTARP